jgi:bacillithiol biosynthesis cysteine-adding enzyme BshC
MTTPGQDGSEERRAAIVDFSVFSHPLSPLFRDYLAGLPGAAAFYGDGRFDLSAVAAAAERTAAHARPRAEVASALSRQQQGRGAERAAQGAARLAEPASVAVVTGQQAGLLGGPLFVLYKAIGVLQAAQALEAASGRPAVPIFWVASDDHDFAEIRSATVLDESGQAHTLRYEPAREPGGLPASQIVLDESIRKVLDEARAITRAGIHRDAIFDRLAECYRPGTTLSSAFARFLSGLLPELVVLDPSDPALKPFMVPVLRREITDRSPTSRLAQEAGERLLAAGYHQQVPVRAGFLNLFVVQSGERRALGLGESEVEVRGLGVKMPLEEAARRLEADPAAWSPGALLRPIVQDSFLPTAAYIGGPAEIAYHAQIGPAYPHFGVPRPVVLPRPSVTLVEPAQARALDAEGLRVPEVQADPDNLVAKWAREAYPEVEGAFVRARQAVERELGAVEAALGAIDPTLRGATDAARGRTLHQIDGLHEKAVRALKKRDQSRAERLRRAHDALFPGGTLQERGLSFAGLLARHGEPLLADLHARIDPWARGHQVIYL